MKTDGEGGVVSEFEESLAALKRDGCSFLVAGDVAPAVHSRAAERFFGTQDGARHMAVVTDDAYRFGPTAGVDPSVVRYRGAVRSAAGATPADTPGTETVVDDLYDLGITLHEDLETYEATNPDPSPGGVRVVVLSAAPLLAEGDRQRLFSWLHLVLGRVRAARGMCFVHFPAGREESPVPTFRPLFDGLVELRARGDRGQQRWHLEDVSSDWLDL